MPEPTSLERLLAAISNLGQAVSEVVVNPNALKLEGKTLDEVITQALAGKASEAGTADNALLLQDKTVNDIVAMVTKTTVGLSNVQNYDIASTQDVTTGTASDKYMTVVRTKQMVNEAVTALVNGAPTALDTLKEIADKLAEDDDTIAALLSSLDNKLDKTGIAADTSLFQGFTLAQVIAQALAGKAATAGNADTATKLATARTLNLTGDATGSMSFDGSANASAALTLVNSGVTAGTYGKVTVNAKGIVTAGAALAASDIPNLDAGKITSGSIPVARGGTGGTDKATARSGLGIGSMATRNVTISTAAPSGGEDGDIWIQYS